MPSLERSALTTERRRWIGYDSPRGRQKKSVTPVVGGGSKAKNGPGSHLFFEIFMAFLNSLHQEKPKNVIKKNREKSVLDFLSIFL
jgi:hypothetical protein